MSESSHHNAVTDFLRRHWHAELSSGGPHQKRPHLREWGPVVVFTLLGLLAGRFLDEQDVLLHVRYGIYNKQIHALAGPKRSDTDSRYVVIDDDTFYGPKFARRRPLNREQLAALVSAISRNNPKAIVMDMEIRQPFPDSEKDPYDDEDAGNEALLSALRDAAAHAALVVPVSIKGGEGEDSFERQASLYDRLPLNAQSLRIFPAYTNLNFDPRTIPTCIRVGQRHVESIALAMIHATADTALYHDLAKPQGDDVCTPQAMHTQFGMFMPLSQFEENRVSAGRLLESTLGDTERTEIRAKLEHKVVIVCGSWHDLAYNTGTPVDLHDSPSGNIQGAFLQANYFEALRNAHYFGGFSEAAGVVIEILIIGISAYLMGRFRHSWGRYPLLLVPVMTMILVSFVGLQSLSAFFDCTIPVVVLLCHLCVDKVWEWFRLAHAFEKYKKSHPGIE